jgi:hypothetical protein
VQRELCIPYRPKPFLSDQYSERKDWAKIAQWVIVSYGYLFKYCRTSPQFWASLFAGLFYALIMTKNGVGYILGDFFTRSSGRPANSVNFKCKHRLAVDGFPKL